ncbi:MFS transporter [Mycena amicta]|nr:MFS transporter [Mycena amicta]
MSQPVTPRLSAEVHILVTRRSSTPAQALDKATIRLSADGENYERTELPRNGSTRPAPDHVDEKQPRAPDKEDQAVDGSQDDYPHGLKLGLLMGALCLSVFLVALDTTISSTATPRITDEFHSLDDIIWYGSVYPLATASAQLLFGKFYTFVSIKWVFISAITIFEIGSAICGAAPTSKALIVGRALAGFGSAGIFSGALIIIAHAAPLTKRPMYTGLIGAMFGIAAVAGPLLGGVFTTKLTWRWCFYINLPIGAVTLFFLVFFFRMPRSADHKPETMTLRARISQFDPLGTIVFVPAIVSLLLALQWGGSKYPWSDRRIIALFVVFGVLIIAFAIVQLWMGPNATVPLHIFRRRSVWSGAYFSLCLNGGFFLLAFYLPIWFQAIKGVSAVKSGISTVPVILSLVLGSLIAGVVVTASGYYTPLLWISSILMAVGAGLLSTFTTSTAHPKWIGYQVIYGLGVGVGMPQPLIAVQTVLPLADVPIGTSILMFLQTLGSALFISIGTNVFTTNLVKGISQSVPGISPQTVISAGATSVRGLIDQRYLPALLEVYNTALTKAFQVSIVMGAASVFGAAVMEWKSIKDKNVSIAGAA